MSERILLKLGGSVITDKKSDCVINSRQLSLLATAISRARPEGMVIVHGAGSCGHPEAKQYHLDKGAMKGQSEGIFVTHRAVSRLNDAVVAALREQSIAAVGVHPLHAAVADNARLVAC